MSAISRRQFFKKTATDAAVAGVLAAGFTSTLRASPLGLPIGSQTYPHRQMIADGKFGDLLKQLKSIGVDQIELCGYLGGAGYPEFKSLADGKEARKIIEDNGLKAVSAHFIFPELRDNLGKAFEWSKALGLQQMMIPTVKSGAAGVKDVAGNTLLLAEAYAECDTYGRIALLSVPYHNFGITWQGVICPGPVPTDPLVV
jgi:sugar phosphate isomerase/epimerase